MSEHTAGRGTANVLVIAGGVLAAVCLFLPWYGAATTGHSATTIGLHTSYGAAANVLFVVAAGFALFGWSWRAAVPIVLTASAAGTIIVLIRWATLPMGSASYGGVTLYSYGPRYGLWLTVGAGLVQVLAATVLLWRATAHESAPRRQEAEKAAQNDDPISVGRAP